MTDAIANIRVCDVLNQTVKSLPIDNHIVRSAPPRPQVDLERMQKLIDSHKLPKAS